MQFVLRSGQESAPSVPGIKVFDCVRLNAEIQVEGHRLPVGAEGAVVFAHGQGEAFEVEFTSPFHAVVGVPARLLTLID
jgi:hypothetical protein